MGKEWPCKGTEAEVRLVQGRCARIVACRFFCQGYAKRLFDISRARVGRTNSWSKANLTEKVRLSWRDHTWNECRTQQ